MSCCNYLQASAQTCTSKSNGKEIQCKLLYMMKLFEICYLVGQRDWQAPLWMILVGLMEVAAGVTPLREPFHRMAVILFCLSVSVHF